MKPKHGKSNSSEYRIWTAMKQRCNNPRAYSFNYYGGRGIKICDSWAARDGFTAFIKDMGEKPTKEHTLDRVNNDGNYEPSNCRWATPSQQASNKRIHSQHRDMSLYGRTYLKMFIATVIHEQVARHSADNFLCTKEIYRKWIMEGFKRDSKAWGKIK